MDIKFGIQEFIDLVQKEHLVQYQRPTITPISYSSPIRPKQNTSEINTEQKYGLLSTLGRNIVDDAFPKDFLSDVENNNQYREKYRKLINGLLDDVSISQAINASENDPDFIQNYGNIGKLVEIYYSLFGPCPVCGTNSLRLFKNNNMPVVDLKCINATHNHTLGPSLWQVKATISDNYFSKNDKLISVGSRKWGENVHLDSNIPIEYKIGYICIKIHQREDNIYFINRRESFIVNPIQENFKYKYITEKGPWGHSRITWEGSSQDLPTLENNGILNFDEIVTYLPTDLSGGMYQEDSKDDEELTNINGYEADSDIDEIENLNNFISRLSLTPFSGKKNTSPGLLAPTPISHSSASPKTEGVEMEIDQNIPKNNDEQEDDDEDDDDDYDDEQSMINELEQEIDVIEVMDEDTYNQYIDSLRLIISEISDENIDNESKLIKLDDMLDIMLEIDMKLKEIINSIESTNTQIISQFVFRIKTNQNLIEYVRSIIVRLSSSVDEHEDENQRKNKRKKIGGSYKISYTL